LSTFFFKFQNGKIKPKFTIEKTTNKTDISQTHQLAGQFVRRSLMPDAFFNFSSTFAD